MKKAIGIFLSLALAVTLCLSMTACSKYNTLEEIQKKGVITVATNAEFPPFESKEGENYVGIDIDIANEIAKALGVKLEINNMDFDSVITSVQKGQSDLAMAGLTVNDKRKKSVDFSDSYFGAAQYLIVKADNAAFDACASAEEVIAKMQELGGKGGAQTGTTGFFFLKGNEAFEYEGFSSITTMGYDSGALAAQALKNGQADMVVIDDLPAQEIVAGSEGALKRIEFKLTEEVYAVGVHKGNDKLLEEVNKVLKTLKDNGKLQEIFDKHTQEA